MTDDARVLIQPDRMLCRRHQWDLWRVIDGRVPNAIGILILIFQEMAGRDEIVAAAGGETAQLTGVLAEFSPACCYLGEDTYRELLERSAREQGVDPVNIHCARCPHPYADHEPYTAPRVPWGRCRRCGRCLFEPVRGERMPESG